MTDDATTLATTAVDASQARRDEARQRPNWSLERSLGAVERTVTAVVGHTGDGFGGLAELHALVRLHQRLDDAIDNVARLLLEHDDASYREIGAALGITQQAAAKRYPGLSARPAGGQPARWR